MQNEQNEQVIFEKDSEFDQWWFRQKSLDGFVPMGTDILFNVCENKIEKFNLINEYLEQAFLAGKHSGSKIQ